MVSVLIAGVVGFTVVAGAIALTMIIAVNIAESLSKRNKRGK